MQPQDQDIVVPSSTISLTLRRVIFIRGLLPLGTPEPKLYTASHVVPISRRVSM